MAEWTEWKELEGTSLYSAVPQEFAGEWDWREVEYRLKDGSVVPGHVYPDEAMFTYTDENGEEVEDYYKEWYFTDEDGCNIDVDSVVAWRYREE